MIGNGGRLFALQCLHVPVGDRTSFVGLLEMVESAVVAEARRCPLRPVYLVGEGFGGALALSVAARNPDLDLILILVNPATSFLESQLQSVLPLLSNLPWEHLFGAHALLNLILGMSLIFSNAMRFEVFITLLCLLGCCLPSVSRLTAFLGFWSLLLTVLIGVCIGHKFRFFDRILACVQEFHSRYRNRMW